ncbi:hypothetical protein ACFV2Z_17745 [Streptomyces sp. NPDC059688]|uniref:hypothetical protein n=1 Tax=Streptomyces sp. NPDC059688 TaxID=3346906 RepID=UPI0036CEB63B
MADSTRIHRVCDEVVSAGAVDAAGGRLIPLAPSSRAAPDQAAEEPLVAAAREASL